MQRAIMGFMLVLFFAPTIAAQQTAESTAEAKPANKPAQEKAAQDKPAEAKKAPKVDAKTQALYDRFEKRLSGSKLVGQFTIIGRDGAPPKEEYGLLSVKKLPEGDFWQFNARIKYGKNDLTVPLRLEVKWAGDTPMITLTNFTIPGLGTFSSRVMFYKNKYAGTWTHGKVGGHMFGTIEKLESE